MTNELCTSWLSLCPSQLSLLCMCQLDVCFHLCVWPAAYTEALGRISLCHLPFPSCFSAMLFPGHIGLIFDLLPGGANGCDPLLCPAQSTPKFCRFCAVLLTLTVRCLFIARLFHAFASVIAVVPCRPPSPRLDFV